ncbi:MAG: DUF1499 domain-containing protein [Bdellovibrionaceae bacterium]|nr:DUF1499 domain-containing protein [Pseudobdellovibrionaceae bacterium]
MNPLKACPDKPNCVSTVSTRREQSLLPLKFRGTLIESKDRLKKVVNSLSRTQIVKEDPSYLHFTFKSALFGFVDDVEFYLDEATQLVHFRSASRLGYSDLGVNRRRMEEIAKLYEE